MFYFSNIVESLLSFTGLFRDSHNSVALRRPLSPLDEKMVNFSEGSSYTKHRNLARES